MITDPLFYAVAVPAVLVAGISKGGFGGGLAMLAVPAMSLFVPAPTAAAIALPILCLMDLFSIWAYRKHWDAHNMRILIPAALIGIGFGAFTFHWFNEDALRVMIGAIAVAFTMNHWMRRNNTAPRPADVPRGLFWGSLAGFTSFVAHAGGPPANAYLLPQQMDKTKFVGTMVVWFTFINYTKLIPYWWLGQFPLSNLEMSAILFPLAPIGVGIGIWLHRRVSPVLFYRICYIFLFVTGLKLCFDGAKALLF